MPPLQSSLGYLAEFGMVLFLFGLEIKPAKL